MIHPPSRRGRGSGASVPWFTYVHSIRHFDLSPRKSRSHLMPISCNLTPESLLWIGQVCSIPICIKFGPCQERVAVICLRATVRGFGFESIACQRIIIQKYTSVPIGTIPMCNGDAVCWENFCCKRRMNRGEKRQAIP